MLKRPALALAMAIFTAGAVQAQTVSEHIALGDRDVKARNASGALAHYEAAIAADPNNYAALWKAAGEAVDLGEFERDGARQKALYLKAEEYGKRAVSANPDDAEGHFELSRALGRAALTMGKRDRVKYAAEVRAEALAALKLAPDHPGALHVMGMWNAEVMRLNGLERFFAKNLLGAKVFDTASWNDAVSYLERSVEVEPGRISHRLDLARVYVDVGNVAKAREQLAWIANAPETDFNDGHYKQEAEKKLRSLK